jgi:hypothetical protein
MDLYLNIVLFWAFGLSFSIGVGYIVIPYILDYLRNAIFNEYHEVAIPYYPFLNPLMGVVERLFFTIIVACEISGTAVAMVSWILVKMVTNWHKITDESDNKVIKRGLSLVSLIGGMISMLFALLGGLIIRGGIK